MNRNLQGVVLTRDELIQIGRGAGVLDDRKLSGLHGLHNDALYDSALRQLTADARRTLWADGQLLLDTRP